MKRLITLVCLSLLFAPEPWGIALNDATRECAGFWGGDERIFYELPEGWEAYYPNASGVIETGSGTCQWNTGAADNREEQCCRELGYTYVAENIGIRRQTSYGNLLICSGIIGLLVAGLAIALPLGLLVVGGYFLWRRGKKRRQGQEPQP